MRTTTRLLLFCLIICFALYFGFFHFEDYDAILAYNAVAYWSMAFTLGLFAYQCYRAYWSDRAKFWAYFRSRTGAIAFVVVAVAMVFLYRAEPLGFKTIMDEHIISATAKSLHEGRTAGIPLRLATIQNVDVGTNFYIDKRPVLLPFLTSIVHDFTGYRPYNAIYLNIGISALVLLLIFIVTERMAGVLAAVMAVLLFATLPLFSYMAAGITNRRLAAICMNEREKGRGCFDIGVTRGHLHKIVNSKNEAASGMG